MIIEILAALNIVRGLVLRVVAMDAKIVAISDLVKLADLNRWNRPDFFKYFLTLFTIISTLPNASCLSVLNKTYK